MVKYGFLVATTQNKYFAGKAESYNSANSIFNKNKHISDSPGI